MPRSVSVTAILLASAAPALAQRANENAVRSADDAFGTSVGNQQIGLYNVVDVRGFSPITAGNIRIEGFPSPNMVGLTAHQPHRMTFRHRT